MSRDLVVWIFQTGEPLQIDDDDSRPMRAINLSNSLVKKGHKVVLWSSDYYHQKKMHRYGENQTIKVSEKLEIRLLHSRGYNRNIGLGRLIDHLQLALAFTKKLKTERNVPDIAFIGYPPIEPAFVLTNWLNKRSVPMILDIKDQWPTLFIDAFPRGLKILGRVIFWPYFYLARKAISNSTGVTSMSNGFIDWIKNFHGDYDSKYYNVFPLTSPNQKVSNSEFLDAKIWWNNIDITIDNCVKICFVGSLSQAFEFMPIKKAALIAQAQGENIKFIICGDGNDSKKIKNMFKDVSNVVFPGWVNRPQIEALAEMCIATIAPYKNTDNFTANIPNKIIDALSLKLPILYPLTGEVKSLIDTYEVGFTYKENSGEELFEIILKLNSDVNLQNKLSENLASLYEERFSYEKNYENLVNHLEKIANLKRDLS